MKNSLMTTLKKLDFHKKKLDTICRKNTNENLGGIKWQEQL